MLTLDPCHISLWFDVQFRNLVIRWKHLCKFVFSAYESMQRIAMPMLTKFLVANSFSRLVFSHLTRKKLRFDIDDGLEIPISSQLSVL